MLLKMEYKKLKTASVIISIIMIFSLILVQALDFDSALFKPRTLNISYGKSDWEINTTDCENCSLTLNNFVDNISTLYNADYILVPNSNISSFNQTKTFSYMSLENYIRINYNDDLNDWDNIWNQYERDLNYELDKTLNVEIAKIRQIEYYNEIVGLPLDSDESIRWGFIVKKLTEKLVILEENVISLKQENQLIKDELCKKDNTYIWCRGLAEL